MEAGAAEDTVKRISAAGLPPAIAVGAAVEREAECERLVEECPSAFGRLDILVNNAGARVFGTVTDADAASWHEILGVNVVAVGWCCKFAIPLMAATGGGSIVNVSSANALAGRAAMARLVPDTVSAAPAPVAARLLDRLDIPVGALCGYGAREQTTPSISASPGQAVCSAAHDGRRQSESRSGPGG